MSNSLERRGSIDIPEDLANRSGQTRYTGLELFVENSNSTGFHNHVAGFRPAHVPHHVVFITRIVHDNTSPLRIRDVPMLLPVICVRFEEGDAMTAAGKRTQDTAIVGCGPVPVRRDQAGTPESNF